MRAQFEDIDIDGSGEVDVQEFFLWLGEPRTEWGDEYFKLADTDDRSLHRHTNYPSPLLACASVFVVSVDICLFFSYIFPWALLPRPQPSNLSVVSLILASLFTCLPSFQ